LFVAWILGWALDRSLDRSLDYGRIDKNILSSSENNIHNLKGMAKRQVSIRYKILLLLTLVPVVTLSTYLALAVSVFKNDKIAYVFDAGVSSARTYSATVSSEVNSLIKEAQPTIQEFLLNRQFGSVSRSIFETEGNLLWIAAFEIQESGFTQVGFVERAAGEGVRDFQRIGNPRALFEELKNEQQVIRVPFKDDRILLVKRFGQSETSSGFVFLIFGDLTDLSNGFRTASNETYLVNDNGFVLFGPMGTEATYIHDKVSHEFIAKLQGRNPNGTMEVKTSSNIDVLASFAKTSVPGLNVVTLVEAKAALAAVDSLLKRSLVFFLLLISVSTIVSLFASGSLTSALTELFAATKKVSEGQFDIRVKIRSNDEIGSLADSFNAMAKEVSRLLGETAEKARMESELKTAQTVQETLFPPAKANLEGFHIAGYYEPASECGGDWWHYSMVGRKVYLWIGDATGHGAPAALITSAAKSAASIIERLDVDPDHALSLLNRSIYEVSKGRIMMTFFLGCYNLDTHELTYANASHEAPFLIKKSEQPLKKKDLIPLNEVNSPRLGQNLDTKYDQTTIKLDLGDRILFYTDGIPDIESPDKQSWGEREFVKGIIATNKSFPPVEQSVRELVEMFSEYRKKAPLKDDITFFMAQVTGGSHEVVS
jgi:sigma-B regulation protein RsbU (phosphoserine phosphatase)